MRFPVQQLTFSVAKKNNLTLGNITVNNKFELTISPNIVKNFNNKQIAQICRRAIDAYSLISTGKSSNTLYYFLVQAGNDRNYVMRSVNGNKDCIGYIKHKDLHLSFDQHIPEYIRIFCVQELKKQNIPFIYKRKRYN